MTPFDFQPKALAAKGTFPLPPPAYGDLPPARLALALLYDLSRALAVAPRIFREAGGRSLLAYFPRSCFDCQDLLQEYHELLALLSGRWEAAVLGTVEGAEVGELSFTPLPGAVRYEKRNVSGRDFSLLSDLCVRIKADDPAACAFLAEAAGSLSPHAPCAAIHRRHAGAARDAGLGEARDGAHFLYLTLEPPAGPRDFLACLGVAEKRALWLTYLADGVSPLEFDWQMDAFAAGSPCGMLEWELALRLALPRSGAAVEQTAGRFRMTGPGGRPLRLDYPSAPAPGRLLLKLLFPAVPPAPPTP